MHARILLENDLGSVGEQDCGTPQCVHLHEGYSRLIMSKK